MEINELTKILHQNAVDHGWWKDSRTVPELLCLIHSEISEALEGYRNNDWGNIKEELADAIIRILDFCGAYEIDIEHEILRKHQKNIERPYKHGNKRL